MGVHFGLFGLQGKGWTQQSNLIEIAILREHRKFAERVDHGPSPVFSAGDTRPAGIIQTMTRVKAWDPEEIRL